MTTYPANWDSRLTMQRTYYANYLKFFERARTEWLRASLVVHQRALRGDTLLCEGEIRIGCVRAHDLKPQRLPDAVAAAMSA